MSNVTQTTISIICCTRNRKEFVKSHVNSLTKNLPDDIELIYALDHCIDGTFEYLIDLARENEQIKIIQNTAQPGLFHCRNFAFAHALGKYIHFLDDDDCVEPDFYRVLSKLIREKSVDSGLIITDLMVNTEGSKPLKKTIIDRTTIASNRREGYEFLDGDLFMPVLHGSIYFNSANALLHRRLLAKYKFHAEIKKTADWLLYLEITLKEHLTVFYVPDVCAFYYVHSSSMSTANDKSYWNMRAFKVLLAMTPEGHSSLNEVKRTYGRALFDAGYAAIHQSKRKALLYYYESMQYGQRSRALKAILKLYAPKSILMKLSARSNNGTRR